MGEPYTIHIHVLEGDPQGAKFVELLNWTGVGIAFPRSGWHRLSGRREFKRSGIYVLTGPTEGTDDERRPSTSGRATKSAVASSPIMPIRTSGIGRMHSSRKKEPL
jgi:hypothetical protein